MKKSKYFGGRVQMEKRPMDRRSLRTKRLIRDALAELLMEKSFERITVKDIIERADINRSTFYLHYLDKFDLLEKSSEEIIKDIEMIGHKIVKVELHSTNLQEIALNNMKVLEYVYKNSPLIKVLLGPKGDLTFQVKLKNMIMESYSVQLEKKKTSVPVEYISAYIASAHLGALQRWMENGMKESPQEMAMVIAKLVSVCISEGLTDGKC